MSEPLTGMRPVHPQEMTPVKSFAGVRRERDASTAQTRSACRRPALVFVCASSMACGEDSNEPPLTEHEAAVSEPNDGGASAAPEASAVCSNGSTVSCVCVSGGTGTSACRDGQLGACQNCEATQAEAKCVAGRYEGTFKMTNYRSGPAGFCGIVAELNDNIAQGEWNFSLSQQGTSEFYTGAGGCLSAGSMGNTPPLHATLTGTVDCATGQLTGELKGTYRSTSVCTLGQIEEDRFFKGTMSGKFDPSSSSFVDTRVAWEEEKVLIPPQPGGVGTWSAVLNPDAEALVGAVDCLSGVVFPDDKFSSSP